MRVTPAPDARRRIEQAQLQETPMHSPALRNRQKILARQSAKGSGRKGAAPMPDKGPVASEYQQLLIALGVDLNALRDIESIERKIETKRTMFERYRPWVTGALDGDTGAQDEIVATMLIWAIDIGEWDMVLALAAHVLEHGIALPERYKRQPATLIAEEVAEAGLKDPPLVGQVTLQAVAALTATHDMHDQVRAKLEKAIGLSLKAEADAFDAEAETAPAGGKPALIQAAMKHFNRALSLNDKCGVKKLIEGLERDLKNLAAPAAG